MQLTRPKPLALFFFVLCFGTTFALGTWQVQRLQWKTNLIASIEAAKAQPPIKITLPEGSSDPSVLPTDPLQLAALQFQPICIGGGWVTDGAGHTIEFHVSPRFFQGVLGYFIISPMEIVDTRVILINRGWVPADKKNAATRPETAVKGMDNACGLIRIGNERNWLTPPSDAARNLWFGRDVAQMGAYAHLKNVQPMMIDVVGKQNAAHLPVPSDGMIRLANDHLSYIITWYGIAVGILVIFILTLRKKEK